MTCFEDGFDAPFPRLASYKLAQALEHTDKAIAKSVVDDSLEPFQQAVSHGVSSNLCESVAALTEKGKGLVIDLSWAEVRPPNVENSHFEFTQRSAGILTEAAAHFRRNEPFLNESIIAQVVGLAREPEEFDGRAVVLYVREGRPLRMKVKFEQSAYNAVIRAFDERNPISMDGDIYRVGNGYELRRPHNLSVITD